MKWPQVGGCESLSSKNNCELLCFSNTGDTIQWIETKIVTYLDRLTMLQI